MKMTRRKLAMLAVAGPIAATAIPAEAQAPDSSDEETRSAHDLLRTNAEAMAKVNVPIATEPAFLFKA
jgi:hypothetical protein